jgi:hypothetical protein
VEENIIEGDSAQFSLLQQLEQFIKDGLWGPCIEVI